MNIDIGQTKIILNKDLALQGFKLSRYKPCNELKLFIDHFWVLKWNLASKKPYIQKALPHPCVELIIENNNSRITGIITQKYVQILKEKGIIFGTTFQPGGFYPVFKQPMSKLTDKEISLVEFFGKNGRNLENSILNERNETMMVRYMEEYLKNYFIDSDNKNVILINKILNKIIENDFLLNVNEINIMFQINKRKLQRLFKNYVGVSLKWLIRRYRLHDATELLANELETNVTRIAYNLGYYDQSHFDKDFKDLIGYSPKAFKNQL